MFCRGGRRPGQPLVYIFFSFSWGVCRRACLGSGVGVGVHTACPPWCHPRHNQPPMTPKPPKLGKFLEKIVDNDS